MPITPDSLLEPTGRLVPSWFVSEGGDAGEITRKVAERLDAYITEGETQVALATHITNPAFQDEAVLAWGYYRAFEALHLQWMRNPSQMGVEGEGQRTYLREQLKLFGDERDRWEAKYGRLTIEPVAAITNDIPATRSRPHNIEP